MMDRLLFSKHRLMIALFLALAMAATRFHHFNYNLNLPDASLAVFFLAGFFLQSLFFFPVFFVGAALIDLGTFAVGGSDWCFTPAYLFLIPTYGLVWVTGTYFGKRDAISLRAWGVLVFILFTSISGAFLFSNVGFYFFSGYFGEMKWTEYAIRVSKYYPSYVMDTFIYVAIGLGIHAFFVSKLSKRFKPSTGPHATG